MGQDFGDPDSELVVVGKLGAAFGVRGWLKVNSYTSPKANIWCYRNWFIVIANKVVAVARLKESRSKFLVLLANSSNRDDAARLTNKDILVLRQDFPGLAQDHYYWVDLIGAKVYSSNNCLVGNIEYMFFNGANDVMVVKTQFESADLGLKRTKEYLIPYLLGTIVKEVDIVNKVIIVDWDLG